MGAAIEAGAHPPSTMAGLMPKKDIGGADALTTAIQQLLLVDGRYVNSVTTLAARHFARAWHFDGQYSGNAGDQGMDDAASVAQLSSQNTCQQ